MKRWIHAATTINPDKTIQKGMLFHTDGFTHEITYVSPDHKTCTVKETWINEDTGKPMKKVTKCVIAKDGDQEFFYDPKYEKYAFDSSDPDGYRWWARMYATGADNYPWDFGDDLSESKKAESAEKLESTSVTASNDWAKYRLAEDTLKKYSEEQVDYVQKCYDEVLQDISNHYIWDDMDGDAPQVHTDLIKTDYLIGAIEDGLMEEEDFEDIYTALETLGEEEAMAYA